MKTFFKYMLVIAVSAGCSQKPASETSVESAIDSTNVQKPQYPAMEETKPAEPKAEAKFPLTKDNLMKFSFVTASISEFTFSDNGRLILAAPVGAEENYGTWRLSENSIVMAFGEDSASFEVRSFTEGELNLVSRDEFAGKLTGEIERGGSYYSRLHRTYPKPYSEDHINGGWQVSDGACSFDDGGFYSFSAPECIVSGTWTFTDGYIGVDHTKTECGSSVPPYENLEVLKVAPSLMIVKTNDDAFEVYWRNPTIDN